LPVRGPADTGAVLPTAVRKTAVAKQVGRTTRGSIPPLLSDASAGHLASPPACKANAFGLCRFNSCPTHCKTEPVRSSIGSGHRPLTAERGVRFPYGLLNGQVVERADTPSSEGGALRSVGVQLSPWPLACRLGRCLAGSHKAGGPARYRGLQLHAAGGRRSQPGVMTPAVRCDSWTRDCHGRVRKLAKRAGREPVMVWVRVPPRLLRGRRPCRGPVA
jgi:hypothetical protein